MTSTIILRACNKVTQETINNVFSQYGTIVKVNIFPDTNDSANIAAEIVFEKEEEAKKALEMNGKKLSGKIVHVEEPNSIGKEEIGEVVYPIAQKIDPVHCAKITGMLVDSMMKLGNRSNINQVLGNSDLIYELVQEAQKKLITVL